MDKKDFEDTMAKLTVSQGTIIMNPKDIEELKKQGIPFAVIPPPTIDQLFEYRKQKAYSINAAIPPLPLKPEPAIKALYDEIIQCILFGLNGAAITMSSILLEYAIKHSIYIKESGGYQNIDLGKWDEFENMDLGPAIDRAKRVGLIDNEFAFVLHDFRENIRNPYAHFNIKKITKNVVAKNVNRIYTESKKIETVDIKAKDDPIVLAQAKPFMDEFQVFHVFNFVNEVVKQLLLKIQAD